MPDPRTPSSGSAQTHSSLSTRTDQEITSQLDKLYTKASSPQARLRRLLSPSTVISTSSSFAARHADDQGKEMPFIQIGKGQCGTIFEDPGDLTVYKLDNGNIDNHALWNDYLVHTKVDAAFCELGITSVLVPRVCNYISANQNDLWWKTNGDRLPEDTTPADILVTERILPLPAPVRDCLIELYCPDKLKDKVKNDSKSQHCLARVLLGKRNVRQPNSLAFFSLRNFALTLDKAMECELQLEIYAEAMGEGLAALHWGAEVDGDDVEWALGTSVSSTILARPLTFDELKTLRPGTDTATHTMGNRNFKRRMASLWLLDFNRCKGITLDEDGVKQIVDCFFRNDNYYPRPLLESDIEKILWQYFQTSYLATSEKIIKGYGKGKRKTKKLQRLPTMVVNMIVGRQRALLERIKRNECKDYSRIPDEVAGLQKSQ
ncbi:Hypothetical protein D9617_27g045100 [Elsinoe fawcettii]|nr:Hypothetical protein D9617_27g045100 [Elsinoe fawcettii]